MVKCCYEEYGAARSGRAGSQTQTERKTEKQNITQKMFARNHELLQEEHHGELELWLSGQRHKPAHRHTSEGQNEAVDTLTTDTDKRRKTHRDKS